MADWKSILANVSWEGRTISDPSHELIDVEVSTLDRARQLLELLSSKVKNSTSAVCQVLQQNVDKNDSVFNERIRTLMANMEQFQSIIQSCANENGAALEERKRLIEQYNFSCAYQK